MVHVSTGNFISAITVHKSVIAFCVGLELFTKPQNSKKMNIFYMGTFAMMSPVSITRYSVYSIQLFMIGSVFNFYFWIDRHLLGNGYHVSFR